MVIFSFQIKGGEKATVKVAVLAINDLSGCFF